jgi:hypothetical protein
MKKSKKVLQQENPNWVFDQVMKTNKMTKAVLMSNSTKRMICGVADPKLRSILKRVMLAAEQRPFEAPERKKKEK